MRGQIELMYSYQQLHLINRATGTGKLLQVWTWPSAATSDFWTRHIFNFSPLGHVFSYSNTPLTVAELSTGTVFVYGYTNIRCNAALWLSILIGIVYNAIWKCKYNRIEWGRVFNHLWRGICGGHSKYMPTQVLMKIGQCRDARTRSFYYDFNWIHIQKNQNAKYLFIIKRKLRW